MVSALALLVLASRSGAMPTVFPCAPGKVVAYEARGRWQGGDGKGTTAAHTLAWRTTFLACSAHSGRTLAIVRGLPRDLDWYQLEHRPGLYAIIQTATGLFIQPVTEAAARAPDAIKPSPADEVLRFPVTPHACAVPLGSRRDGMYCWYLESAASPGAARPQWTVSFRTLPDTTTMTIVPGIGITAYRYRHHGTVAEVSVKLVPAPE